MLNGRLVLRVMGYAERKLEVIIKPKIHTIWTAAADVGSRDDKAAEFGARVAVVAVKNIGAHFQLQILGQIPNRPGLQDSGWVLHIVDGAQKYLEQGMQLQLDFSAQVVFAKDE